MHPKYANKTQFKALAIASGLIVLLATVLYLWHPEVYTDILGVFHPLVALQFIILIYFLLFLYLLSESPFLVFKRPSPGILVMLLGISLLFGGVVIAADLWWVNYPQDINVLLPESLLYYPVMGFMAEAVFHVLPITLTFFLLRTITRLRKSTIVWMALLLAVLVEPIFQMIAGDYDANTRIFTGILVFGFSAAQLWVFRYYGWVSMFVLRLFYYLIWHILWGEIRVDILFS